MIIVNLGVSKDLLGGWLLLSSLKNAGHATISPHLRADADEVEVAAAPSALDLTASAAVNPLWLLPYLPSGDVLFANNRTTLDLRAPEFSITFSSQFIYSWDDVAYTGNQSECTSLLDMVFTDGLALGATIRAADNRFQEGLTLALFSLITVGLLMNTTPLNQASHCIVPVCVFRNAHGPGNTILYKLKYCKKAIQQFGKYFGKFAPGDKLSE